MYYSLFLIGSTKVGIGEVSSIWSLGTQQLSYKKRTTSIHLHKPLLSGRIAERCGASRPNEQLGFDPSLQTRHSWTAQLFLYFLAFEENEWIEFGDCCRIFAITDQDKVCHPQTMSGERLSSTSWKVRTL